MVVSRFVGTEGFLIRCCNCHKK